MKTIIYNTTFKCSWIMENENSQPHKISKEILAYLLQTHTFKKQWEGKTSIWFNIKPFNGKIKKTPARKREN